MSDEQPKDSKKRSKAAAAEAPTPDPIPETLPSQPDPQPAALTSVAAESPIVVPKQKFKGIYGKGYKPDTHDKSRDLTIRHLLGAKLTASPSEFMTMEQFIGGMFGVKDQGQSSECLAFAMARAAQLRCAFLGIPLKDWLSTNGLYTVARAWDRAQQGLLPAQAPLTDDGSIPLCMVQGANEFGVALDAQWPFDLATINDEPKIDQLRAASMMKFPGYYRISSSGAQRLEDVKQALAAGYPVVIGVQVDPAFEAYSGGIAEAGTSPPIPKAVTAPDLTNDLGGHGLCLYGYKTFPGSVTLLRGCNSWGEGWGDYGLFWADVTWLLDDSVMDILVITCDPSHYAIAA